MKKFLICFAFLFVGLSCTKNDPFSSCGCSFVVPSFSLIIKNQQNADLLDPAVPGAYNPAAIKIKYKMGNILQDVSITIKQPFQAVSSAKFPYYSINSVMDNLAIASQANTFYIDFGNGDTDTLTADFDKSIFQFHNLKLNNKQVQKEPTTPQGYPAIYFVLK